MRLFSRRGEGCALRSENGEASLWLGFACFFVDPCHFVIDLMAHPMTDASQDTTPVATTPLTSQEDLAYLREIQQLPFWTRLGCYLPLSGPGWLQGAITLGGGSLSGSLYLGVLAGFGLMWLQPLAMIMGIIMLSSIAYVSLSTGERPFDAINRHINPVLGWGWAIATMMANFVWCMPQFALGTAAIQQNLLPNLLGSGSGMDDFTSKLIIVSILFVSSGIVIWFYDSGGKGIKIFEKVLKAMVAVVVISFFGVVAKMTFSGEGLDWGAILAGFVPNFSLLSQPATSLQPIVAATGEYAAFWSQKIVKDQQQVMITAAATAVGINMTFLLPYSMLKKGWGKVHRELAIFDLAIGLFFPFMLATSCVVIAAASQFHAVPAEGFLGEQNENGTVIKPAGNLVGSYNGLIDARLKKELGDEGFATLKADKEKLEEARASLPLADRRIAAMLVTRDAFNLADSLKALTGPVVSQFVFGIGVLGMAISTIIILMLINGFVFCEIFHLPHTGLYHRLGCFLAAISGALGPFIWSGDAKLWLAVPTSMFAFVLLPIAYFTFFFMMNSPRLMGPSMPRGPQRLVWNLLMLSAASLAAFGSIWSILSSPFKIQGLIALGVFVMLAVVVGILKKPADPTIHELNESMQA